MGKEKKVSALFDRFSGWASKITGSPGAFMTALAIVIVWIITGPLFHYSNSWQLIINTGTTIITFLMVFIIQEAQNKDTMALQMKLNELIAATKGASNKVINVEDMSEEDLKALKKLYDQLNILTQKEKAGLSHSIDEIDKSAPGANANKAVP